MIFLKHFRHFYIKYGWAFLIGISLLVAIDWYQLEIPRILNQLITGLEENEFSTVSDILPLIQTFTIIVIGITLGRFLWRWSLVATGRQIETEVRLAMFNHATTLSQDFYSHEKVGSLMAYFINDLEAVRQVYSWGLLMLVDGLVLGAFVLTRMFSMQVEMTLYAFIPMLFMCVFLFFVGKKMEAKFKLRQESFERMSDFTQENYSGISVIKAYVREAKEAIFFNKKAENVYDTNMSFLKYSVVVNMAINVTITAVIIAIIIYGSLLIGYGGLTSGEMIEYVSYFFTLIWPVFAISQFIYLNGQAQASAKRIHKFLETKADIVNSEQAITDANLTGAIEVRNLSFNYPDDERMVLDDITFKINAGEMVGVLGRTGSGKSSLVELLLHVYNVKEGMIFFDQYDTMHLNVQTLRDHIGYVPQDNFLFSESIKKNIGFAFDDIGDEKVEDVAKLSDIYENVKEFKDGFETILGERGVTVSGGQKQRISIARALAKDPTILILDDSVSAVDTKTEEAIISNLRKVRKGKTTIFIAHRISTVKKLDKIILLDQGKLVGFGTHAQLLRTNTLYQEMVKLQKLEQIVEEGEVHA